MAERKIVLEFKDRHLSRPELDKIVGAQIRAVPDATEIIVRCRSATREAIKALEKYRIKVTLSKDS